MFMQRTSLIVRDNTFFSAQTGPNWRRLLASRETELAGFAHLGALPPIRARSLSAQDLPLLIAAIKSVRRSPTCSLVEQSEYPSNDPLGLLKSWPSSLRHS